MNAQPPLGLSISWVRVTVVFLVDVAILIAAGRLPESWQPAGWWSGVGVVVAATLIGLVTYRGVTLPSALAGWLADCSSDAAADLTAACTPAIDHRRRYGREAVGVREHRGRLVTLVAVDEPDVPPAGRHVRHTAAQSSLPVTAVAAGLRQFDVHLDGADIVSVRAGDGARSTWLVLRMDPQRNSRAVASRDSLASTMVAATERLAHDLNGRRCTAWPMSGDELAEVDSAVLADLEPTWRCPGWRRLKHAGGYATSFWVSPRHLTSEALDALWPADVDATVVTVRITAHHHGHDVSAWVRYHSYEPLAKSVWAGLNRFTGRQLPAVRAGLPAPATRPLRVPSRRLSSDDELAVPLGPVGAVS